MRLLFIGDIVGLPGVNIVCRAVPLLLVQEKLDLVVANAENAASGAGLTVSLYRRLRQAGVDLITLGDHIYKRGEIISVLERDDCVCRPANFPDGAPGRMFARAQARDGSSVVTFAVLGRTHMKPVDCPFRAADRVLASITPNDRCIIVDVHAEATGDKYQLAHYLKGRVSAILGTHTHVATADEQLLGGTAYISDVGMTGPYDSILGRRVDRILRTVVHFVPTIFDVAEGDPRLAGAIVDIDPTNGRALSIRRVMLDEPALERLEASGSSIETA